MFFQSLGITPIDFVDISVAFLLQMSMLFGVQDVKWRWLNYTLLALFTVQVLFVLLFHEGLPVKLFGFLMLISAIVLQVVVARRRTVKTKITS